MLTFTRILVALAISALSACKLAGGISAMGPATPDVSKPASAPQKAAPSPRPAATSISPAPNRQPSQRQPSQRQPGQTATPTKEQWDTYHALVRRHRNVLRKLASLEEEGLHGLPANPATAAEQLRALEDDIRGFSEFASECGAYVNLEISDLDDYEEPRAACRDLERVDTMVAKIAADAMRWFADREEKGWHRLLKTVRDGYPIGDSQLAGVIDMNAEALRASLKDELKDLSTLAGETFPWDERFVGLEGERDEAIAKAPVAAAKFRYHRQAPKAAARVARNLFAKARYRDARPRIIEIVARDADWRVSANRYTGVPVSRSHRVQVIAHIKGETFCRMYELDVNERYFGAGRWSKPTTPGITIGPRVTSCKN